MTRRMRNLTRKMGRQPPKKQRSRFRTKQSRRNRGRRRAKRQREERHSSSAAPANTGTVISAAEKKLEYDTKMDGISEADWKKENLRYCVNARGCDEGLKGFVKCEGAETGPQRLPPPPPPSAPEKKSTGKEPQKKIEPTAKKDLRTGNAEEVERKTQEAKEAPPKEKAAEGPKPKPNTKPHPKPNPKYAWQSQFCGICEYRGTNLSCSATLARVMEKDGVRAEDWKEENMRYCVSWNEVGCDSRLGGYVRCKGAVK